MRRLCGLLVIVLTLGACAEEPAETEVATPEHETAPDFTPEQIAFGEALAQIRGHHDAATELYDGGDTDLALVHAGHPIDEILASVSGELEEHAPDEAESLPAALEKVRALIEEGAGKSEVAAAVDEAAEATFDAQEAVVGEATGAPDYVGSVVAALLKTAAHEYEEAVAGGEGISLLEEYQDGYAFATEAEALYADIEPAVSDASEEEAEEIEEAFDEIAAAFPALEAPEEPVPPAPLEAAAELIGHELEETVGAVLLDESDPADIGENIHALLTEILETYEAGDAEAAAELSAEAYLENYEVIEAEVIEQAPEINQELEPLLGADLRKEILAGAPAEEIEAMIERARVLLDDALAAIEEH